MATRTITFSEAINEAIRLEMRRDPTVILMGEDVAGGATLPHMEGEGKEAWGGVLGVTKGLVTEFGRNRVLDTPISESAFIGAAVGAASTGLRPIAELMFVDFLGVCFDQIFNQGAKMRYMFGGKAQVPMVIRTTIGAGFRAAAQHSECLYSIFTHIPGLKTVVPSTPYDAKGHGSLFAGGSGETGRRWSGRRGGGPAFSLPVGRGEHPELGQKDPSSDRGR
jgi:pyruvate dehydrogenase E1 component beta subunit